MMQAFRNAAKPVVLLITVTFLAWMIVDLSGLTGKGGLFTKTTVGSINGQSVDTRLYQQALQNAITDRQKQTGGTLSMEEVAQVRNEVWDQFVMNALLNDEMKKRHITVSDDEVAAAIQNVPPNEIRQAAEFMTNGQFDMGKYQRWLASPLGQQNVPFLEARYRDEIMQQKLMRNVTADILLSDAALWERYRDAHEMTTISLTAIISRNIVPDSLISVTPAEVDAYYAAHKDEFKRPRTAFMSFVAVSRRLDASDSAAALQHIQELRAEIAGGAPFADVARRESTDSISAKNGGELPEMARSAVDPAFGAAAMSLPLNTLSQPVLSQFGYHLIEVTKRAGDKFTAKHILVPITLAGKHRDLVDAQADSLERLGAERLDPAALDTLSRALKLPIGATGPVQEGSRVLLGTAVVPDAAVWAFQARPGETSPVIEGDGTAYVFRLDSVQQAGTPALNQIRLAVERALREKKKDDRAREIGKALIARLDKGEKLPDASKAMGLPNQTYPAFPRITPPLANPAIVGAAFGLAKGQRSGLLDTKEGIYVIEVVDRVPADSAAFVKEKDQVLSDAIRAAREERVRQYVATLKADAKIKDDRAAVQQTNAQAEAAAAAVSGAKRGS